MYLLKIKRSFIALCLFLLPLSVSAAGLGQLNVSSSIGEPLKASIEVLSATPAEISTLKANLASEEVYLTQGVERTAFHKEIRVSLGKANGKDVVKLSSNVPLSEPYLDMLIVLEWSNGRVLRQYTALLDPPTYQPPTQKPSTNTLDNASIKKITGAPVQESTSGKISTPKRESVKEHLTRRGDTLYKIARRMKPAGVSLDEVLVALFEANPDAFDGNNMNRLKVGKILQAPTQESLDAMTRKKAAREIKLQTADWHKYRNKLAQRVAKSAPKESSEDTQSTSGKIKSAAEDQAAKGNQSKDVVKLSTTKGVDDKDADSQAKITALQEEISAREQGLKDAEERTALLEKQVADMEKLLALKDNALAAAQAQSAEKAALSNEAEPPENAADAKSEMAGDEAESVVDGAPENEVNEAAKPNVVAESQEQPAPNKPETKAETPVKPVVDNNAEEKPSFLASLMNAVKGMFSGISKTILMVAAGLIALLLLVWLFFNRKRNKTLEDFEQSIMTSGSLKENTVFGNTVTSTVAAGDTSFLTDFSQSSASSGLIDTNDVDPIAEAEVYMAYGRDAQAEEILKDAIVKEPQRYELHLKLLEMYAANKNTAAFDTVAGEMYATLGADHPTWKQVAEIGAKLDPNNPLYQVKESETPVDMTAPEIVSEENDVIDSTPEVASESLDIEDSDAQDVISSRGGADDKLDASDFSDSPLAAEADLDFSVADGESGQVDTTTEVVDDAPAVEEQTTAATETVESPADTGLEFSLSEPNAETSTSDVEQPAVEESVKTEEAPSLDFPALEVAAEEERPAPQVEEATEGTLNQAPELDIPDGLTLDVTADSTDDAVANNDFDFGADDEPVTEEAPSNVMDISDISLDVASEGSVEAAAETPQEEAMPELQGEEEAMPANEEVETKLELVAAYIDMEDKEGATELLEEVLKEGNFAQRKRADQMLKSLT